MRLIAAGSLQREESEAEEAAVALAEHMTRLDRDVDDETFERLHAHFDPTQIVELAAWISLQNFYSTFNPAFRIEPEQC